METMKRPRKQREKAQNRTKGVQKRKKRNQKTVEPVKKKSKNSEKVQNGKSLKIRRSSKKSVKMIRKISPKKQYRNAALNFQNRVSFCPSLSPSPLHHQPRNTPLSRPSPRARLGGVAVHVVPLRKVLRCVCSWFEAGFVNSARSVVLSSI
jgi:hypothetical protein